MRSPVTSVSDIDKRSKKHLEEEKRTGCGVSVSQEEEEEEGRIEGDVRGVARDRNG